MSVVALSELLGATVRDATGTVRGRVRELAVAPQEHPTRIAFLIVKTADGERMLPPDVLKSAGTTVRVATDASTWERYTPSDGVLLLKRDLLDQQIIDVHGRKVVRVNDVELESTPVNSHLLLNIVEDLAPAEREAVFETIDEEVAAEALEEIDPDIQVSIVDSLDKDRVADI